MHSKRVISIWIFTSFGEDHPNRNPFNFMKIHVIKMFGHWNTCLPCLSIKNAAAERDSKDTGDLKCNYITLHYIN